MAFANILDISSFFIGMLINLLLIALICYYFKRKYESLEMAQNEQAKILYNLIQQQQPRKQFNIDDMIKSHTETICLDKCIESESDSDSESDSGSDADSEVEVNVEEKNVKTINLNLNMDTNLVSNVIEVDEVVEVLKVEEVVEVVEEVVDEDYSKLTIKQLKDILSKKGIFSNNKMKKTDLIQLIETGTQDTLTLNLSEELNEVNI